MSPPCFGNRTGNHDCVHVHARSPAQRRQYVGDSVFMAEMPEFLQLEFQAVDGLGYVSETIRRQWGLWTEMQRFTRHENSVSSVTVTPNGRHVVSASGDGTVRVWYIGDLHEEDKPPIGIDECRQLQSRDGQGDGGEHASRSRISTPRSMVWSSAA